MTLGTSVIVTLVLIGPPPVWQVSVNVLCPVIGAVVVLRDEMFPPPSAVALADVPGPVSVQLVTCDADHVSVELLPEFTRDGDAPRVSAGLIPFIVTLACLPVWSHCTVYMVLPLTVTVAEPLAAPFIAKFADAEVFGDGHDHVSTTGWPMITGHVV